MAMAIVELELRLSMEQAGIELGRGGGAAGGGAARWPAVVSSTHVGSRQAVCGGDVLSRCTRRRRHTGASE